VINQAEGSKRYNLWTGVQTCALPILELGTTAQRDAYLALACEGNPQLRAEVDSLLKARHDAEVFFEELRPSAGPTVGAGAPGERLEGCLVWRGGVLADRSSW